MEEKAINLKETSFTQAINISAQWCKEWGEDLLSEEVLADRVAELIKTKNGLRGFFAYALSDQDCYLLDKLPFSVVFKLQEGGNDVVKIIVKNLIMSSAQIVIHDRNKNLAYKSIRIYFKVDDCSSRWWKKKLKIRFKFILNLGESVELIYAFFIVQYRKFDIL